MENPSSITLEDIASAFANAIHKHTDVICMCRDCVNHVEFEARCRYKNIVINREGVCDFYDKRKEKND